MQRQERQYCFCYHFLRPIYDCILSVCGCFLFQHKLPSPFIASFDGNIFTSLSLLRFSPIVSVTRFDEILPALAKIPKVFCPILRVNLLLGKILSLLWLKIMLLGNLSMLHIAKYWNKIWLSGCTASCVLVFSLLVLLFLYICPPCKCHGKKTRCT